MNSLLQKHGCANVFSVPEGLKELLSDISREVLRDQPENILEFIANYLAALLITREHGLMAVRILEDLCDCKLTLEDLLEEIGMPGEAAKECARMIQESFDNFDPEEGETLQEKVILKKLMCIVELSLEQAGAVCKIIQDVYRDYWQRKQCLQETISTTADEPWEQAAQRTVDIYKTTRPTLDELVQATVKIQAAYRGYHVRREMMGRLRVKEPSHLQSTTTTLDVAGSREIDLGPKMDVQVDTDLECIFDTEEGQGVSTGMEQSHMQGIHAQFIDKKSPGLTPKLSLTSANVLPPSEGVSKQGSHVTADRRTASANLSAQLASEGMSKQGSHVTADRRTASANLSAQLASEGMSKQGSHVTADRRTASANLSAQLASEGISKQGSHVTADRRTASANLSAQLASEGISKQGSHVTADRRTASANLSAQLASEGISKQGSHVTADRRTASANLSAQLASEGISKQGSHVTTDRPASETTQKSGSKVNAESDFEEDTEHSRSEGDGTSGHITDEPTSASIAEEVNQSGAETADEVTDELTENEAD